MSTTCPKCGSSDFTYKPGGKRWWCSQCRQTFEPQLQREHNPLDVLRDSLTGGHSGRTAKGLAALAQVEALVEVAKEVNDGAKRDLPEWYADDGEYSVKEYEYFIRLDTALAPFVGRDGQ